MRFSDGDGHVGRLQKDVAEHLGTLIQWKGQICVTDQSLSCIPEHAPVRLAHVKSQRSEWWRGKSDRQVKENTKVVTHESGVE